MATRKYRRNRGKKLSRSLESFSKMVKSTVKSSALAQQQAQQQALQQAQSLAGGRRTRKKKSFFSFW
jgi:hypothetical protein